MSATIAAFVAMLQKKLSDPYDYRFPCDRYDRYDRRERTKVVVATIAGEWFPYDRSDRWTFFAAVVAIIWKLALNVLKKKGGY